MAELAPEAAASQNPTQAARWSRQDHFGASVDQRAPAPCLSVCMVEFNSDIESGTPRTVRSVLGVPSSLHDELHAA
jgi:hypothetical protein